MVCKTIVLSTQTPSLVGETDTKAIMAQIKYVENCQSAMGEGKSLGVVNKARSVHDSRFESGKTEKVFLERVPPRHPPPRPPHAPRPRLSLQLAQLWVTVGQ